MKNEEVYNTELARRFRELRKEAHLTQAQLASKLHISTQEIYNYEKARRRITETSADLMAMMFSIDASYLLDETFEYRTAAERINIEYQAALNKSTQEKYNLYNTIISLATLNGYDVEIQDKHESNESLGEFFSKMKEFMVFKRSGEKEFSLSLADTYSLGNIISDNFMTLVQRIYIKKEV